MTQPTQEWLEARSKASAILDRFIVSLRRGGQLWAPIAVNGHTPYMECINAIADLIEFSRLRATHVIETAPEGERLCGGDHCTQLWNLPCDDPRHRGVLLGPPPKSHPEGVRRHICSECGVLTDCHPEGA